MHKLDRTGTPEPECLLGFHHSTHNWSNVSPEHRAQVRSRLEQMQGRRCAYCEGPLDKLGHHIEHFRNRANFPQLTFQWDNLYLCCNCHDHCGHYKDNGAGQYNPDDILDPCNDDPEEYLRFYSDGSIRPRPSLDGNRRHRASETLRVFNLDHKHGPLRQMRKQYCIPYVQFGLEIAELAASEEGNEWMLYVQDELGQTRDSPFVTAIRHTLLPH